MAYLSKYGVARHVRIPIVKRAVVDHAVSADWTPSAGDVKISKDGGAAANVTNLPTAIAMGNSAIWDFSLTATEMQAAEIVVTVADSATKAVEDTAFAIETYGNASAQHEFDLDTASSAQTGDSFARIGATGSGLTSLASQTSVDTIDDFVDTEVAAIKAKTDQLTFTTANKVDSTIQIAGDFAQAAADKVWSTTTRQLTGTQTFNVTGNITGNLSGSVGSVTGAVGSVTGAVGSVTGAVGSVTGAVGSVTGAVGSVTGNVGGNVTGSVGSVAAGGITATSFGAAAIDAAAASTDFWQEGADRFLARNIAGGSDTGRIVADALAFLRNRKAIAAGTLSVYGVDDTTVRWTAAVTTTAGNPVSEIDPA